jgi:hypothetical protein
MRKARASLLVAAVVLVLLAAFGWAFRHHTDDNPALGITTYRWRWGRPYSVEMDRNRDGRRDLRCLVDTGQSTFSPHTAPSECWVDTSFRGNFDRHVIFERGNVVAVDLLASDGTLRKRLTGAEAQRDYTSSWSLSPGTLTVR